jgi:hypothetical protein
MLFLEIYINGESALSFLFNISVDGESSTSLFNCFSCNFKELFYFDRIPQSELELMFTDGRFISPILARWLHYNTNLVIPPKEKSGLFIDESNNFYRLKCLTKHGLNFRPSSQLGIGRVLNQIEFEEYCNTQTFIIANVINFPVVEFKLIKGKDLLKSFPTGKLGPKEALN